MQPDRKARLLANLSAWSATIALFLIWEISVHVFQIREFILPAPSAIWKACVSVWPNLLGHSLATLGTVLMGFFASVIISLPLAMLIASSPTISAAIYPLLVITQSIPKVALAPILIVALGANEMPRIIVTFLVAFFPLVVSSVAGRPQGRGCAFRCGRGGGGIRRRGCRAWLSDPDLHGLLPHATGVRGCGCACTDGYCAIPSGGAGGATVIPLVQQRRRHQHSSELNGASYG